MSISTLRVTLNDGNTMPLFGLGTWLCTDEELKTAIRTALDSGYRLIDTAYNYLNEEVIGVVLEECLRAGKVTREELFITTKLAFIYNRPSDVAFAMSESLRKLKMPWVDLYLVHGGVAFKKTDDPNNVFPVRDGRLDIEEADIEGVWKEMEKLVDQGKTKSIGVSNFTVEQMERIHKVARIMPVTNQVECHAYHSQNKLEEHLRMSDIPITAFAPIGSPDRGSSNKFVVDTDTLVLLKDSLIAELATKYKKTPAQILLRNLLQRNVIVIPKSVTPSRIRENANVFDFHLSSEDMLAIATLDKGQRLFKLKTNFTA